MIEAIPNDEPVVGQAMLTPQVIKGLISFLSHESTQPLWNYEDITAKGEYIPRFFVFIVEYLKKKQYSLHSLVDKVGRAANMLPTLHRQSVFG